MPEIREYPEALTLLPTDAFVIDRLSTGTMYIEGLALVTSNIWVGNGFYEGSAPPLTQQLLGGWNLPVKVTMPDTYANALTYGWGAHVQAGSLPTANFTINLALNNTLAATLVFHTDGTWTYSSSTGLTWVANVRDRITAVAPTITDATMNNFFFTMAGLLTA